MCSQPSGWLGSRVILDSKGLSRPARNFLPTIWPRHFWPLSRAPHLLETSLPGTFAGGDVRSGNVKRVAVAVGEGSIAVLDGLSSTVRIIGENDEGSDTPKLVNFRRPMDTSGLIPAFAAILGSIVGGLTTFATTFLIQRYTARRDMLEKDVANREKLYSEFLFP